MKRETSYKVIGKSAKETKKIEDLKSYIRDNFNTKGKRLGISNFIKQFGKFNDEKQTLQASSVVTVKDIQTACRLLAAELVENGSNVIPCVVSQNAVITIEVRDAGEFDEFYPEIKPSSKGKVNHTEFIVNYIKKYKEEIDVKTVRESLDLLE
jgi:hypothetical protein